MASRISPAQRGPSWHNPRKVWRARVRWNGISQFLGYYETREEAEKAEKAFRDTHFIERDHAREMNRLASIAYQQRRREERLLSQ